MKKSILVCLAIGLVLSFGTIATAAISPGSGIQGTLHDLSAGNPGGLAIGTASETRICIFCHTPHFAAKASDFVSPNTDVKYFPLWNHDMSTAFGSYATYTNGTDSPDVLSHQGLNATIGQPGGVSKLCLSCHDGSVAVNSYGHFNGNPTSSSGGITMPAAFKIGGGGDLSNHHPIGFNYANAAALDDELYDAGSPLNGGTGLTINEVLWNGSVECVSCHSVHNKKNEGSKFLWVSDAGSALCLSCHNK